MTEPSVHVEANIYVEGDRNGEAYGGSVHLTRVRGEGLIKISAMSSSFMGGGSVRVDPRKLRDALDELVNEDLGA